MKRTILVATAVSMLALGSLPVRAQGIEDLVRANCTPQLVGSTDVTRGALKSFRVSKRGNGYVMQGQNDSHQIITCETEADGTVTWVHTGN